MDKDRPKNVNQSESFEIREFIGCDSQYNIVIASMILTIICSLFIMSTIHLNVYAKVYGSGNCGNNLTYTLSGDNEDNQTLTISGTGEMWDFYHGIANHIMQ